MKDDWIYFWGLVSITAGALFWIILWSGLIYVAVHFINKYW